MSIFQLKNYWTASRSEQGGQEEADEYDIGTKRYSVARRHLYTQTHIYILTQSFFFYKVFSFYHIDKTSPSHIVYYSLIYLSLG